MKKEINENIELIPKIQQLHSICNLATIECCYHTVAEINKDKGKGLLNIFKEKRKLWIQTVSKVKVGIDVKKVKLELKGNKIICTLPKGELLSDPTTDRERLKNDENNIIVSKDGFLFKNPIEPDEQSKAMEQAYEELKSDIEKNSTILDYARERAIKLIENYINKISEISEHKYDIEFVEV